MVSINVPATTDFDVNLWPIIDPSGRYVIDISQTTFGTAITVDDGSLPSLGDGDLDTGDWRVEAPTQAIGLHVLDTSDANMQATIDAFKNLFSQKSVTIGVTVGGVRRVAVARMTSFSEVARVSQTHASFVAVFKIPSAKWRDPVFTTVTLPDINDHNLFPKPSPQVDDTGFGASGTGVTGARVAGVGGFLADGVTRGYGHVVTFGQDTTTNTAGANIGVNSASRVAVTPGAFFQPTLLVGSNITTSMRLRYSFLNAAGTEIYASYDALPIARVANAPVSQFVPQGVTVPNDPLVVTAALRVTGPNVGTSWKGTRTNSHRNARGLGAAWTQSLAGGTATGTNETTGGPSADVPQWRKLAFTAAPTASPTTIQTGATGTSGEPVLPNTPYAVGAQMISQYIVAGAQARVDAAWYDSTGTLISTSQIAASNFANAATWERRAAVVTSPATAAFCRVSATFSTYQGMTIPGYVGATAIQIEQVPLSTSPLPDFFDGDSVIAGRTAGFSGAARASASTLSGDTIIVDQASTVLGTYGDGSFGTQSNGDVWSWDAAAYASTSTVHRASKSVSLTSLASSSAPISDAKILVPGAATPLTSFSLGDSVSGSGVRWQIPTVNVGDFLASYPLPVVGPVAMAVDSGGVVYYAGGPQGLDLYKMTPDGVSTFLRSMTGDPVLGLAVTKNHPYLFVLQGGTTRLVTRLTLAGATTGLSFSTTGVPTGIAVDALATERVFVTDSTNNLVRIWTYAGAVNPTPYSVTGPRGVASDGTNVFVLAFTSGYSVTPFSGGGSAGTAWSVPTDGSLAADASGNVYLFGFVNFGGATGSISKYTSAGSLLAKWGSIGSGVGQWSNAYKAPLAIDGTNNVLLGDPGNQRVNKYDGDGVFNGVGVGQWLLIDPNTVSAQIVATADFDATGDQIRGVDTVPWAGKALELSSAAVFPDLYTRVMTETLAQVGGGIAQIRAKKAWS